MHKSKKRQRLKHSKSISYASSTKGFKLLVLVFCLFTLIALLIYILYTVYMEFGVLKGTT